MAEQNPWTERVARLRDAVAAKEAEYRLAVAALDEGWTQQHEALRVAAQALIDDVRRRYPGEELRCPFMLAIDKALLEK